jgi:AcrR family transcriptional regulator
LAKGTSARATGDTSDVRESLVRAAMELLEEMSPEELSLRDIARRAGVSHAAPYHHFESKAALLGEVARRGFIELDASMADAQRAAPSAGLAGARAQLLATGVGYFLFSRRRRAIYQLMMERPDMCERTGDDLRAASGAAFVRLVDAIAVARTAASLPIDDTREDALFHWSLVHGISSLVASGALGVLPSLDDEVALVRRLLERTGQVFSPRVALREGDT